MDGVIYSASILWTHPSRDTLGAVFTGFSAATPRVKNETDVKPTNSCLKILWTHLRESTENRENCRKERKMRRNVGF